ncbi:protein-disulfide reductase DsbD domain-containing protein [Yoonia sediminilitoris]|nr:protein-disulfide reductase DsbD domain-containing protein [Yoonia sediminilitoris]
MPTTAFALLLPVLAAAGPYDDLARVEVLPGWRMESGEHMAGLRITLEPGWKTYWRAPGDAGIPPSFQFAGSDQITGITPHWPVPEVIDQNGMMSIGYYDGVVFPLTVTSRATDVPLEISGTLSIGVCEEICIPVTLDFQGLLPSEGARDASITAALINQPLTASEAGVGDVTCALMPIKDGLRVTTIIDVASAGQPEHVIVEAGTSTVWVSEADISRTGSKLHASVDMVPQSGSAFALDRSKVRITVLGSDRAIDIRGCSAG